MIFYKTEAKIINTKEKTKRNKDNDKQDIDERESNRRFRDSEEWKNFKEFSSHQSDEFYRKYDNNTYIFAVGVKGGITIQLGIISRCEIDTIKLTKDYLTIIDTGVNNIKSEETTLRSMIEMLRTSNRADLIKDDDEVLELFNLDDLSNRHNSGVNYSETIYSDETSRLALINKASSLLCSETLIPEIERIYQVPSKITETGHPVHYMILCNDPNITKQMVKVLFPALFENKRIGSRRCCSITIDDDYRFPSEYFGALCRSCFSGVIVVNYLNNCEDDGEYASPDMDTIEKLCENIKKYKNNVLTFICLPRSNEKVKKAFIDYLGSITIVPVIEDTVFGERAKRYLRHLAKDKGTKPDKSLYSCIRDNGKGYSATDLNVIFDKWHSIKLKTKVYPQYAAFESSSCLMAREKPKGSAYSELEKMIGLSDAKSVINRALDFYKAQKLFKDKGMPGENTAMHMVFTGNPGTAKTTAARLFAQIMKENGLLSEGSLYEVGRADLVGKFVGWTAQIVKQKFKIAKGSVLFIDEAYSLVDDKDGLFGDEAINTIVQEMENNREDMVVIFAGYPDKMETFLRKNPGLRSRIAFHVPFSDYDSEELLGITRLLAESKKLTFAPDVGDKLLPIFETHLENDDFGNGRFARNLLEKAQMKQASRLISLDPDTVTKDDVLTLTADDFEAPPEVKKETRQIGFCA